MASTSKHAGKNGIASSPPRSDVLTASLVANVLLVLLLVFWASQASRRDSARVLGRLSRDVEEVAGYVETADRALRQQQAQDQTLRDSLADARAALGQQAALLDTAEALKAQLQDARKAEAARGLAWLTVGIPTVPRKEGADYLTRTLETLLEELPADAADPLHGRVRVLVMNNSPGNHSVFDKVRRRIEEGAAEDVFAAKARVHVRMLDNPGSMPDPTPDAPEPDDLHNPKNIPGREVRKQTRHLITLMEMAVSLSHYYLFMEDDFRVCPNTVRILHYIVRKLNAVKQSQNWLAVRLSYGMNGILLPSTHLADLAAYMRQHVARLPPDLLWVEWTRGKNQGAEALGRTHDLYVYKRNLLDHLGRHSSFTVRVDRPAFPACFQSMANVWSLDQNERFKASCDATDLSPCRGADSDESWTRHPIEWPDAVDDYEVDHPPPPASPAVTDAALAQ